MSKNAQVYPFYGILLIPVIKRGVTHRDSHEERRRGKEWRMCNLSNEKRHGS